MARNSFQTLTEPMYYVLIALLEEQCGVDIMSKVEELSSSRVKVGPGTLYAMIDKFLKAKMIKETKVEGRKKSYIITSFGQEAIIKEYQRLNKMILDGTLIKELLEG